MVHINDADHESRVINNGLGSIVCIAGALVGLVLLGISLTMIARKRPAKLLVER